MSIIMDPTRRYQIPTASGQVSPLLMAAVTTTAGNDKQIVAAVTGQIILIMGWISIYANAGTAATFLFNSGSGGSATALTTTMYVPPNSGLPERLPLVDAGTGIKTKVDEGLYANVGTNGVFFNVQYITYTPS